jgi:hypothetical protein
MRRTLQSPWQQWLAGEEAALARAAEGEGAQQARLLSLGREASCLRLRQRQRLRQRLPRQQGAPLPLWPL